MTQKNKLFAQAVIQSKVFAEQLLCEKHFVRC